MQREQEMAQGPVLSVVDYAAWENGYMPPSEHVLIDKLAYRGAKVVISSPVSKEHQMWIVIEGPPLTNSARRMLRKLVDIWFEDDDEKGAAPQEVVSVQTL